MNRYPNRNLSRDQAIPQPLFGCRHPLFCLAMLFCLAGSGTVVAFDQPQVYQLKPKDRVCIMGDSTTVDGFAVGGYAQQVIQALKEQIPDQNIVVNARCRSTRKADSFVGWVEELKTKIGASDFPTVVIGNFGLNDSGAGEKGLAPYTDHLRRAVALLREMKVTPILCTPTTCNGLDRTKLYAEAVRTLTAELKVPLIDLYAAHAEQIVKNTIDNKIQPGTSPVRDGTHLTIVGETLSASAFLKAFGLKPVWQKYQLRVGTYKIGTRGSAGGKITLEPDQPFYAPDAKVTLTFLPDPGNTFTRWFNYEGIVITETTTKLTVTMDRHKWIMAEAKPDEVKKP